MAARPDSVASTATAAALEDLEQYRRELTGYCYRMLGSGFEAEDAVQEAMVKAWRGIDQFEGRSAVRSWLYRIATNVCLDMLRSRQRRARPMDFGPSGTPETFTGEVRPESAWVTPVADDAVLPIGGDPAELAEARDTIRLAFVTALQSLPARQRAVLLLREVLKWQATEVAELLDTSVASVNSALQRARATLASRDSVNDAGAGAGADQIDDEDKRELLARYVDAFERYDVATFVSLLREDAIQTMPPFDFWLQGNELIGRWMLGPGIECKGSRLVPTSANGCPAYGQYRVDPAGGYKPWSLNVLELSGDRIVGYHNFLDAERLFAAFGLPAHLP
jgi:RNA polymerase sigma-70 factor (ECF subfamily)